MDLLAVEDLTKRFGGLTAVREVSFAVGSGEIVGMIGPNGAGKTTTFAMISGFLRPTEGRVFFAGEEVTGLRPDAICRRGMARTFQIVQPFPELTTLENVMVGRFRVCGRTRAARAESREVLERVRLADKAEVPAKNLTLAERKRLEIGRCLATEPRLILLDETAAGLTPVEMESVIRMIRSLREEGLTFLVIEHVMALVMNLSDRILVLHHGELIAQGTPAQVSQTPAVIEAYLGEET